MGWVVRGCAVRGGAGGCGRSGRWFGRCWQRRQARRAAAWLQPRTYERRAPVVAQRARQHLARAGAGAVDQQHHGRARGGAAHREHLGRQLARHEHRVQHRTAAHRLGDVAAAVEQQLRARDRLLEHAACEGRGRGRAGRRLWVRGAGAARSRPQAGSCPSPPHPSPILASHPSSHPSSPPIPPGSHPSSHPSSAPTPPSRPSQQPAPAARPSHPGCCAGPAGSRPRRQSRPGAARLPAPASSRWQSSARARR